MKMFRPGRFVLLAAFIVAASVSVLAQEGTFSDSNVEYSFALPDSAWKMIVKPSATSPNVEYVYNDRLDGHFEIRKLIVGKNALMSDVIRDEEMKLQFQPGYVAGKEENFAGNLRGNVFNYEFVRAGRSMSGRLYFLRIDNTGVYMLRFTGERDKLKSIRNQTDSIARTFKIK